MSCGFPSNSIHFLESRHSSSIGGWGRCQPRLQPLKLLVQIHLSPFLPRHFRVPKWVWLKINQEGRIKSQISVHVSSLPRVTHGADFFLRVFLSRRQVELRPFPSDQKFAAARSSRSLRIESTRRCSSGGPTASRTSTRRWATGAGWSRVGSERGKGGKGGSRVEGLGDSWSSEGSESFFCFLKILEGLKKQARAGKMRCWLYLESPSDPSTMGS